MSLVIKRHQNFVNGITGADQIDRIYDRAAAGDVRYRYVIDTSILAGR
jgi:D-arabinose 1-dehydrogenase-like Zn-dependent alcohol dehydrogenase